MSQSIKTKTVILSMAFAVQCSMAISLVISGIGRNFPDASVSTVQLVYTIMTLVALPTSLLVGKMATFFTKKCLSIIAFLLQIAGGLAGFFLGSSMDFYFHGTAFFWSVFKSVCDYRRRQPD